MFCTKCGRPVAEGANFCTICGTKIERIITLPSITSSSPTSVVASSKPIPVQLTASDLDGWSGEAHSLSEPQKPAVQPTPDSAIHSSHRRFRWPWVLGAAVVVVVLVGILVGVLRGGGQNITNNVGMKFVKIPAGTFMMGTSGGDKDEQPAHSVTISSAFYMATTVVTQAQWQAVMGSNVSYIKGDNLPVENVSWDDCQQFISRLNERDPGKGYRLPTEAEWEYACRAGNRGERYGDIDAIAWYDKNSGHTTHPVGQKQPNAWGLYDMNGNVWQWCQDWYKEEFYSNSPSQDPQGPSIGLERVYRGGSWNTTAWDVRSAFRSFLAPDHRYFCLGLRVVAGIRNQ